MHALGSGAEMFSERESKPTPPQPIDTDFFSVAGVRVPLHHFVRDQDHGEFFSLRAAEEQLHGQLGADSCSA